jgi:hypothetical protein
MGLTLLFQRLERRTLPNEPLELFARAVQAIYQAKKPLGPNYHLMTD